MIYPDLEELISLQKKAKFLSCSYGRKSSNRLAGLYSSVFRGQGIEFDEIREYVQGDDVRSIEWIVTARKGRPHIKVFKEERQRSVIFCIDNSSYMHFGTRESFKSTQVAKAASLLAWSASYHNDKVGALIFGNVKDSLQYFSPVSSKKSIWRMLSALTKQQNDINKYANIRIEESLNYLANVTKPGALIFVLADFNRISSSFERQLTLLNKKSEVILLPVNDPADWKIPDIENVLFADENNNIIEINTSSENGRLAYKKQWEKNQARLNDITKKLNVGLINLYTNQTIEKSITEGLKKISVKKR